MKVIDGDTLDVFIDLGFGIYKQLRVRLFGINAPEIHGEEKVQGENSKHELQKLMESNNNEITLEDKGIEKYGRQLAEIFVGETNVSQYMLKNDLAWVYYGTGDKHGIEQITIMPSEVE